jgi:hypothetical protein
MAEVPVNLNFIPSLFKYFRYALLWRIIPYPMSTRPAPKPQRIGKSGDEIFMDRADAGDARPPKKRGRRPSHTEQWTKVTVVLFDRQIVFLDRLCADIRAGSGVAISRAHVIRALIDGLTEAGLDLTGTRSEADLRALFTARLGRLRN